MSTISVIIPAYKARKFLPECLESIGKQTLAPAEVLVIDDASPEPVDDIVKEFANREGYPPIRLIIHEKNQGLGGARNTGIREARGKWIALLDHDDLWMPRHLDSLLLATAKNKAELVFCSVSQFKEQPGDGLGVWGPTDSDMEGNIDLALFEKSFITPSATLIRRKRLLEAGGFNTDPRVHMCEDLDLWLRLLRHDVRFAYVAVPTCLYRKHNQSATGRPGYMAYQSAWVRQLHAPHVEGNWFTKRSIVAYRWWLAWLAFLALGERRWDILARAIWLGIPVPHQILRGINRTLRQIKKSI